MISHQELVDALLAARVAADVHKDSDDGGTCNMDTVIVTIPRMPLAKMKLAASQAGVTADETTWLGRRRFFVWFGSGQGNRRTRMAEAASKALKERGLDSQVWYQMD